MNDLLLLVNHPLRGNVAGILTSQNPSTTEGLECRLSVRIHGFLPELPHSTEQEPGILHRPEQIPVELPCSSYSKDSRQVGKSSGPQNLTSLSTLQEWTWEHCRGLNLTLFTLSTGGSTMVFIGGVRQCCGWRMGMWGPLVRPAGHASWLGGQVSIIPSFYTKTKYSSYPWPRINCSTHTVKSVHR
jgi:hypothetical protein